MITHRLNKSFANRSLCANARVCMPLYGTENFEISLISILKVLSALHIHSLYRDCAAFRSSELISFPSGFHSTKTKWKRKHSCVFGQHLYRSLESKVAIKIIYLLKHYYVLYISRFFDTSADAMCMPSDFIYFFSSSFFSVDRTHHHQHLLQQHTSALLLHF